MSPGLQGQDQRGIIHGDWFTADGSDVLMLSVQNDYILYDSEFWNYEWSEANALLLTNQSKSKKLSFIENSDGILLTEGERSVQVRKGRKKTIKSRPVSSVNLRENFFNRDQVILHGVVEPTDTMPLVASVIYNDAFKEHQPKYSADIDEFGRFKLIFPLNHAQDLFFQVGDAFFIFYARPGAKMAMKIEENSFGEGTSWSTVREIGYMGDLAQLNEEYRLLSPEYMKIRRYKESDSLQRVLEPMEFNEYRTNLKKEYEDFYQSYFDKYPTSEALKDISLRSIRISAAEDMMRYIWLHKYNRGGSIEAVDVPDEYIAKVTSLMPDDPLDFTSGNYGSLNREFTMPMMPKEKNKLHDIRIEVIYDFLSNSLVSENSKLILSKWKAEEAKRERHFGYVAFNGDMKPIYEQYKDEIAAINSKVDWDNLINKASKFTTVQRSSIIATYLNSRFHARAMEIPTYIVEKLEEIELLPLVRNNINEEIRNFEVLRDKKFIEGVEIAESSDNILAELKNKYKGKVVYIDVWATWCGPCISEFSYLKELKANKLKDVVYVYLCAQSDKKSFDLMVKKHELVGENYFLDKDQYSLFDKEVNITGFPTYMIITKEGKLIREGIKRPSAKAELVSQLKSISERD
ncbi:hypothetical protein BFP71_17915 [Roseivirga misakiensis]|uniref:Thioredoxin domain-containing protein n=2 Tax=Roseivirga misakiensis TaxID=1563681 RepID=A0A1E5T1V1_9BACT|nr:hypothetical protein BFP71_17915 [Roseivirga misakiensis]